MEFKLKSFKREISVPSLAYVHYFEFTQDLSTARDSHGFPELVYVERGRILVESDCYTGELNEGELILHGENEKHALSSEPEINTNIIIIGFECKSKNLGKLTHAPLPLTDELQKMLVEIVREGRSVYLPPYDIPNTKNMKKRRSFAYGADQLIKNYLQIFLIKCLRLCDSISRSEGGAVCMVGSVDTVALRGYLDCNFCQKIKIDDLCFLFNTNKTTLSREFKEAYGQTVIDYVNRRRIDYTKELLREGGHTLTDIAEMMNMSSVHYLTALFKKLTGISPTEYAAKHKG
ncbi:MAG: helix-turn-helix transcriptional regulator [Clostridia bacterium]|nr:helix-turn-helix transcriptional regulator [Clostridia bacterium]